MYNNCKLNTSVREVEILWWPLVILGFSWLSCPNHRSLISWDSTPDFRLA